jgi:hypothetical protein
MDALPTVRTVDLRRAIFKRKKEITTIFLGLIYHSMALSQPQSRDTVPLSIEKSTYARTNDKHNLTFE